MKSVILALIRFYQKHAPKVLPPTCRFHPSCSQYAVEAIEKYGVAKGTVLATRRLLRCHPFSAGGYDPVK